MASTKVPTAAVFESGRIIVNPSWFLSLSWHEREFVMAHELLHLALQTHQRCHGTNARLFNVAHDYIINDILREALGRPVPAQGLDMPGAAKRSAEDIALEIKANGRDANLGALDAWMNGPRIGSFGEALAQAGAIKLGELVAAHAQDGTFDVLSEAIERAWFPDLAADGNAERIAQVKTEIDRALALGVWHERLQTGLTRSARVQSNTGHSAVFDALRASTQPPWEFALQRWMEDIAPPERTFQRASRRQGDRTDIVLPGRRRDGWTLNLILDTSGSMWELLPKVLGVIRSYCEAAGVAKVRIIQCGEKVEIDERVDLEDLDSYRINGGGGSDMRPGFARLAEDIEVEAAICITDGMIHYPARMQSYEVLWALVGNFHRFKPPYGSLVRVTL